MPPIIYIEREPLLGMIMSAVEVYNKECVGYLFGSSPTRSNDSFRIKWIQSLAATSKRTNSEYEISNAAVRRMEESLFKIKSAYPFIACFHSHAAVRDIFAPLRPGKLDRSNLVDNAQPFGIIINIMRRRCNRRFEWRLRSRRTMLRGSIEKFIFHIFAYRILKAEDGSFLKFKDGSYRYERLVLSFPRSTLRLLNRNN